MEWERRTGMERRLGPGLAREPHLHDADVPTSLHVQQPGFERVPVHLPEPGRDPSCQVPERKMTGERSC